MARGVAKSIEQHKAEGTFRANEHEGKGMAGELVTSSYPPPKRMNPKAANIWRELLPIIQKGQVFKTDLFAFEVLCNSFADYLHCVHTIYKDNYQTLHTNTEGATNTLRHYLSTDKKQSYDMLQQMLGRFGLTPVDRAKIYMAITDQEEDDELAGLV